MEISLSKFVTDSVIFRISEESEFITIRNINTLNWIVPTNLSKIRNTATERKELTSSFIVAINYRTRHSRVNREVIETKWFITSTLVNINVYWDFGIWGKVSNMNSDMLDVIVPTRHTTDIAIWVFKLSAPFMNYCTINWNDNCIISIKRIDNISIEFNCQERVRL